MNTYKYRVLRRDGDRCAYEIEYAGHARVGRSLTVEYVAFQRFNETAKVSEEVRVHWTEAFRWADHDPCGGLALCAVYLSDGSRCFASGLYFNPHNPANQGQHGLSQVVVGAYGSSWLWRRLLVATEPQETQQAT